MRNFIQPPFQGSPCGPHRMSVWLMASRSSPTRSRLGPTSEFQFHEYCKNHRPARECLLALPESLMPCQTDRPAREVTASWLTDKMGLTRAAALPC
jgi:hypothetical protein